MTLPQTGNIATRLFFLALLTVIGPIASAGMVATVDRTIITDLDVVTLRIRASDKAADEELDFSGLERDFEILNNSTSSNRSMSIVNGRTQSVVYKDHQLLLRPKRLGNLLIPPVQAGGEFSEAITIRVQAQTASQRRQMNQYVFFETEVDTSETYVQGQVIYAVRLFYTEAIGGDFPQAPTLADAVVETVENERRFESIVGGKRYYVLEKRYAIFPQRSGELNIPRERFIGTRGQGGIFSQRQRVTAVSEGHIINVKRIPGEFSGNTWIPARSLTIAESWADEPPEFRVGEPVNRQLNLFASGLPHTLLPDLGNLDIENAKVYADPPVAENRVTPEGLNAIQVTTVGIVPTKEGELRLPEIRIPWWNTLQNREEVAVVPAAVYQVLPAIGESAVAPTVTIPLNELNQQPDSVVITPTPYWQWAAIAFGFLWLFSSWQWLLVRRDLRALESAAGSRFETPVFENPDESREFKSLAQACTRNQPANAHRQLFLWAKARDKNLHSLADLTRDEPSLAEEVARLEQHLYSAGEQGSWRGATLQALVTDIRRRPVSKSKQADLEARLNPA